MLAALRREEDAARLQFGIQRVKDRLRGRQAGIRADFMPAHLARAASNNQNITGGKSCCIDQLAHGALHFFCYFFIHDDQILSDIRFYSITLLREIIKDMRAHISRFFAKYIEASKKWGDGNMVFHVRKISVIFFAAALLALGGLPFFFSDTSATTPAVAQNTNWGLSFQKLGAPPVGNASAEYLAGYHAYFLGDTSKKTIYLTFDAGFENGNTPKILDVLRAHKTPATFFLVGNYLDTAPELVRRMVEEGHTVGNHTATHPDMSKIADRAAFERELHTLEEKYRAVTGQEMQHIYRPPQGKFSEENLKMANEMGYQTVFWSLAYVDWYTDNQPTRAQAFEKLLPRTHPGAVVLLHSTSKTNADILDELLTRWEQDGYTVAPISELLAQQ